jgi:hypothetical protein
MKGNRGRTKANELTADFLHFDEAPVEPVCFLANYVNSTGKTSHIHTVPTHQASSRTDLQCLGLHISIGLGISYQDLFSALRVPWPAV